ncbi:flagellar hook-basal body complex protein [Candidatus Fukatsuia symbiotica]|uniref:Flagellar hook protein FlgE n=1 Tax=Candidatus Fukatsuia symbiotica TaxID=1878942 RepID=A0A2U8I652_9GAMM|nr:flagellar hook-basal body complex protein [Candidatus Fukatsuia symbiotica]AWK14618.1 hypothetical protein CCS41_09260 [Candidatus Fukatsuia symbiotica]MEA9444930.1 flagellar hook-basal body complex protein [Candidatus Fukatsuia symbiotica]
MSNNIAVTGLDAITKKLKSISNNIANSGTIGYKSEEAEFAAMYSQGDPMGVAVSGVSHSISRQGTAIRTDNNLDVAINGNGFFILASDEGDTVYTRAGNFDTDIAGNLIGLDGKKVQGSPVDANGVLQQGVVGNLKINKGMIAAKASSEVNVKNNLDARMPIIPTIPNFDPNNDQTYSLTNFTKVYDSLGNAHSFAQYFVKTGVNEWTVHYQLDQVDVGQTALEFNTQGKLITPNPAIGNTNPPAPPIPGIDPITLAVKYNDFTQYGASSDVNSSRDGNAPGTYKNLTIQADGKISASYSNGESRLMGQILLASFANESHLAPVSKTSWAQTALSGDPVINVPNNGLLGELHVGQREGSNVDVTDQLVKMLSAQHDYQGNAQVLTTNKSMQDTLMRAL